MERTTLRTYRAATTSVALTHKSQRKEQRVSLPDNIDSRNPVQQQRGASEYSFYKDHALCAEVEGNFAKSVFHVLLHTVDVVD